MYNNELMLAAQERLGLTNRDIANAKALNESTVSRYMSGAMKDPNALILSDICDVLELSVDAVLNRSVVAALPVQEGATTTENLLILRDFTRGNFERLRAIEREKDAGFNRHIDHLKEQIDKYAHQIREQNRTIFAMLAICAMLLAALISVIVVHHVVESTPLTEVVCELEHLHPDDIST